ncbi:uncharacterized protein TM35_000071680 [Trypanosoma theileri]|uniref:Uncharacterized protein n=1 Tax=Trypanosoma theileri TaxID=67003 RepID=A0A1X0P1B9_9TRYP|nr:uncharacterized protein TM35_000071680 [Trypanosoma theileri]ORC90744.1 hypothetical protein TM35_000071680 [Trypanosoma theileri]
MNKTTNAVSEGSGGVEPQSRSASQRSGWSDDVPKKIDLEHDRQSIAAWRQTKLNKIILEDARKTYVSREDHRLMLKQLISTAYFKDKERKANIDKWKRIVLAVEKEYIGANALFTLSPDPYHQVLAKLSSMMIWNDEVRQWGYDYCTGEITRRRAHHVEVLARLKSSGKLFLN